MFPVALPFKIDSKLPPPPPPPFPFPFGAGPVVDATGGGTCCAYHLASCSCCPLGSGGAITATTCGSDSLGGGCGGLFAATDKSALNKASRFSCFCDSSRSDTKTGAAVDIVIGTGSEAGEP